MATLAKPEHLTRRNAPSRASVLGLTAVGTLAVGLLAAPPAFAADFTVSTSAELIQAIHDANNSPGLDTIIVDGVIVLDTDLPQITDDLTIRGVDGAVIDGDGMTYRGLVAHEIDSLTVEDLTLRAILFDAINSYDVEALVITGVSVEESSGYGIYVYAIDDQVDISDVEVRGTLHDGVRVRLFSSSEARIHDVAVIDSGHAEIWQLPREHGAVSVTAAHDATAVLSDIRYTESDAARNPGDDIDLFAGVVVNTSEYASVSASGVTIEGPLDTALRLTAADSSEIEVESLTIHGDSTMAEYAVDVVTSGVGSVSLSDFIADGSGALLAQLGDDSQVNLSHGTFDDSGIEAAMGIFGADAAAPNGRFTAHELTVQNAPWLGVLVQGIAEASLTSVTLAHNGVFETGTALLLAGNDQVVLSNSTISNNRGAGVGIMGGASSGNIQIASSTIADNTAEQFAVLVPQAGDPAPGVHVRNSIISGNTELQLTGPADSTGAEFDHSGVTSDYTLWNGLSDDFADFIGQAGTGNIVNVDPQLGALADNGGFTHTRLPATGSPVIDAGDPDAADTPDFDQRGEARIDGVIDMGAVEVGTLDDPGDEEPGDEEPGDEEPGDEEPGQSEPGEGAPDAEQPGGGGVDDDQRLAASGGAASAGLLALGGITVLAGLALLTGRLRRRTN